MYIYIYIAKKKVCIYIYILLALGRFRMQEMDIYSNKSSLTTFKSSMLLLLYVKIDYLLVKYVRNSTRLKKVVVHSNIYYSTGLLLRS